MPVANFLWEYQEVTALGRWGHNYPGTDWLLSGDQQLNVELSKWMEEFDLRTPAVLT